MAAMPWLGLAYVRSSVVLFLSPLAQTPPAGISSVKCCYTLVILLFHLSYHVLTCEFIVVLFLTQVFFQLEILGTKPLSCLFDLNCIMFGLLFELLQFSVLFF